MEALVIQIERVEMLLAEKAQLEEGLPAPLQIVVNFEDERTVKGKHSADLDYREHRLQARFLHAHFERGKAADLKEHL